jgi:hypothetical protein
MAASLLELHNAPAEKTASVFRMVMTNALSFMGDPELAQCVLPHAGTGFDIGEFIRSNGTLYLIATGDQEQSPLAPLFATLVKRDQIPGSADGPGLPRRAAGSAAGPVPG